MKKKKPLLRKNDSMIPEQEKPHQLTEEELSTLRGNRDEATAFFREMLEKKRVPGNSRQGRES